ncbi:MULTISPECIES: hypothetical protein [unclassified Curtobacterium]|nr:MULTISPECIES: hypothetical protein [unclassified Curtobacterium]RPE85162.1 hypothetical protein EDF28_1107 [Curtobacterium sp. PhB137]TCL79291.1 hypothetical protein EDF23_103361 [Curtobacterium sp. PhB128]TCL81970.1 hypothetical protein EDF31_11072 [Curtobacterium sp. PhB142]TCL97237.1 hypothetical protein EDF29_10323 [Curtobacterium sp. PhB138]TCL99936.1 hypothetical protein EDF26_11117 [Curtobacterium sp. PhB134]
MDRLSTDTVPLTGLPARGGLEFIVHIDEAAGVVSLDLTAA